MTTSSSPLPSFTLAPLFSNFPVSLASRPCSRYTVCAGVRGAYILRSIRYKFLYPGVLSAFPLYRTHTYSRKYRFHPQQKPLKNPLLISLATMWRHYFFLLQCMPEELIRLKLIWEPGIECVISNYALFTPCVWFLGDKTKLSLGRCVIRILCFVHRLLLWPT